MNYYLIANNPDIKLNTFNKIPHIAATDIVVTFNHCLPMNSLDINEYSLYHFSRRSFNRKIPYSGLHIIDKIKDKFEKIFLYPHPDSIRQQQKKTVHDYIKNHTSFSLDEISHMPGFGQNKLTVETRKFLSQRHNKISNMSMGLIGYLFLKQNKSPEDTIYLIGFTHKMNKNKHNAEGERDFFAKEQGDGLCHIIN